MSKIDARDAKGASPAVSVIIPVRNGERTLARAIDSALGQTFDGFEVIVIDNASNDGTAEVIRRYGDRIVTVFAPLPGLSRTRNAGIFAAQGEYLAFLDADDEWMPEKLAQMVPLFVEDPECVLAYHDAVEVDTAGRVIKNSYYPLGHNSAPSLSELLWGKFPGTPILPTNVMMRRAVATRIGGFNEELFALEDVGMWILAREHGRFRYLPRALARREWEASERREDWYINGGRDLYRILLARYGRRVAAANLIPILNGAGTLAMLRGDRRLARRRYMASLRLNPARAKTWLRLCTTLLPHRLVARGEQARRTRVYGPADHNIAAVTEPRRG
ncbi:MAG: glycosyltransferase [Candidatus Binataceae bacterium]